MTKTTLTTVGLLILLLAGCGSSPRSSHYVLTAQNASTDPQTDSPVVGIRPVEIPAYLKRNNLISQLDGNKLEIAGLHVWGEPLDQGIERVIGLNLAMLLNTRQILFFPWHPSRSPHYAVEVTLVKLHVIDNVGNLVAEWQVYRTDTSASVARSISHLRQPTDTVNFSADDIPALYSQLFYQLSETIAAAIQEDMQAGETDKSL